MSSTLAMVMMKCFRGMVLSKYQVLLSRSCPVYVLHLCQYAFHNGDVEDCLNRLAYHFLKSNPALYLNSAHYQYLIGKITYILNSSLNQNDVSLNLIAAFKMDQIAFIVMQYY